MDGEEMLEDERKIPGWGTPEEDDSAGGGGGELEFTWICSRLWWNLQHNVLYCVKPPNWHVFLVHVL
jgi:hypothetical protein